MRASVSEYLSIVIRTWWARVSLLAALVGLASELTNLVVPTWIWWVVVSAAAVLAQFTAFLHVRLQRDELAARLAAVETPAEPPTFVPNLLEGRIFPTSAYPVIESGERGFVIRGALAFALDEEHEQLGSEAQKLFEEAVAASAFEGWLQAQTGVIRAVPAEQWWKRVQPTRSNIVTVARAPTRLPHYEFTLAGHCVLNLKPGLQPWHPGYGLLIGSAVIRPRQETSDGARGRPLSFDDLYEALSVIEAALVDQIAPTVLAKVATDEFQPRAYAVLAIANGGSVTDYVALDHHHWSRAAGSGEPNALYGQAMSELALRHPEARDAEIKSWLARFLTDAGFSEFESDVDRLQPPRLPEPLPT